MKQLALGLHNYHDTYKAFPYSTSSKGSCTDSTSVNYYVPGPNQVKNHRGWLGVLPFIEQAPLGDQLDFRQVAGAYDRGGVGLTGLTTNGNDRVVSQVLDAFLCPSDPGDPRIITTSAFYRIGGGSTLQGAKTSYDFQADRYTSRCILWTRRAPTTRFMFGVESYCSIRDVLDGTSNTVMLCETMLTVKNGITAPWGYSNWTGAGVDVSWRAGPTQNCVPQLGLNGDSGINFYPCCTWSTPQCANLVSSSLAHWGTPGSFHPGGCQVSLADGSTRFISETTAYTVRAYLARMADGQVIGSW
jgi:hypothetical protein